MEKHIHTVYIEGRYPKYEVNLITLQDRVKGFDGWTKWRDIPEDAMNFYKSIEPEMFKKRNKLIHM